MSEWRVVLDWPDYEVSDEGQVRRGTYLMGQRFRGKYLCVWLRKGGRRTSVRVHKLITTTFFGPCPEGLQVRHLNDDKMDNSVKNLQYGTSLENSEDGWKNGSYALVSACKYEHVMSGENLRIRKDGSRRCMECQRRWDRESDEKKRQLRDAAFPSEEDE